VAKASEVRDVVQSPSELPEFERSGKEGIIEVGQARIRGGYASSFLRRVAV
jgi:hypothetical protein